MFEVPEESRTIDSVLNAGKRSSRLPFNYAHLWINNGESKLIKFQNSEPALYYGGFFAKKEAINKLGLAIPSNWVETKSVAKNNDIINVYSTRNVVFAPIAARQSWVSRDGKSRSSQMVADSRHHAQLLVLLADRSAPNEPFTPWGPAILTAKGYQTANLLYAPNLWSRFLQPALAQHAPDTPAWAFWMSIGTFGNKIKTKTVGKGDKTSFITPIELWKPKGDAVNKKLLESLFVGSETASYMANLHKQATDWIDEWSAPGNNGNNQPSNQSPEPEWPDDDYYEEPR